MAYSRSDSEMPVLIVGGGPVGLSASLALSRHGVRSLLVERRAGTSTHPKARGLNVRTLELFRIWGIEAGVRAASGELERARDVVWAPTLVSPETKRLPYGGAGEQLQDDSPATSVGCAQDQLEPILLDAARSYGLGELRFSTELVALREDERGVTASVVDRESGREEEVHSVYAIAADGAQSAVRQMLGVDMRGPGALFHRMGIYFRADLRKIGAERPALLYLVAPPEGAGVIAAVNLADLWLYMAPFFPDRGERRENFDESRCVQLVRGAVGMEDLEVEVLSALPWAGASAVAERFRVGRVFLAGDAAHLIPPTGGQAMNVGIQEVHNLAWKLAGRLGDWAGEGLLDTYEAERRPFALAVNGDAVRNVGGLGNRPEQFSNRGRVLGVSYDSPAVVPDGTDLPIVTNEVTDYAPTARPGSRAPHLWLRRGNERISALDLFDQSFVLLTDARADMWAPAAKEAAARLGLALDSHTVGAEGSLVDQTGTWASLYGVQRDGAVLVRPDGHVAWRTARAAVDPLAELLRVCRRVLALG